MEHITLLLGIVIVTALAFDFTNGFHDTANAMATTISTGALGPKVAVAMSAVLNLVGAFLSVEVAKTISSGIVDEIRHPARGDLRGAGRRDPLEPGDLAGRSPLQLLARPLRRPDRRHRGLRRHRRGQRRRDRQKVLIPAVAAPVVAGIAALLATRLTYRLGKQRPRQGHREGLPRRPDRLGRPGLAGPRHQRRAEDDGRHHPRAGRRRRRRARLRPADVGDRLRGLAIALGTYLGGWRIIRTMGKGITDIQPPQGFAAQTGAATVILASSHIGFALSTTQVCSGAVMGAGVGRKGGVVRWSTAGRMVVAWALTLPAAGLVAAARRCWPTRATGASPRSPSSRSPGCGAIWVLSRRKPVDHTNVNDAVRVRRAGRCRHRRHARRWPRRPPERPAATEDLTAAPPRPSSPGRAAGASADPARPPPRGHRHQLREHTHAHRLGGPRPGLRRQPRGDGRRRRGLHPGHHRHLPYGAAAPQGRSAAPVARTGAYACFALCAAAVAYGIYLIVA